MTYRSLIIDGVSILNSITRNAADESAITEHFIGHVRHCLKQFKPSRAIVITKDPEHSPELKRIIPIIQALGMNFKIADEKTIGPIALQIARHLEQNDEKVLLSSSSLSMSQTASSRTDLFLYGQKTDKSLLSKNDIEKIVGIPIPLIPSLVALIGDQEINLRNFIGPQSAIALIKEFGDLEAIIRSIASAPRAIRTILEPLLPQVAKQGNLAKFSNAGKINIDISITNRTAIDVERLHQLYIENKFYDWLPDHIREIYAPKFSIGSQTTYTRTVENQSDMEKLIEKISSKKAFSIALNKEGNGVAISMEEGRAYYIDFQKDSYLLPQFLKLMESSDIKKVAHDAKDIYKWALKNNFEFNALQSDSAILAYAIDTSNSEAQLHELCENHLDIAVRPEAADPLMSKMGGHEFVASFYGEHADAAWRINRHLYGVASRDINARLMFESIDRPLIKVLAKMEHNGIHLDAEKLNQNSAQFRDKADLLQKEINSIANKEINVNSPVDVNDLLFNVLKLNPVNKAKENGLYDTSEESLIELSNQSDITKKIAILRSLLRSLSTNTNALVSKIDKETNRVHARFMQNVTATTRISSRDPNVQGTEKSSDKNNDPRNGFTGQKSNYIISADYSQAELRILADLSGDENLIAAFNSGVDVHKVTAAEIFNIPISDVTDKQRSSAKAINFGIVYGLTDFGLAKRLKISPEEAKLFKKKYFEKFPKVEAFIESTKSSAREKGYVLTKCGRKLFTHQIASNDKRAREHAERAAINAPMQGSVADIIKKAMLSIDREIEKRGMGLKMIMQVHDELVFEVPKHEVVDAIKIIKEKMESAENLAVKLETDITCGKSWSKNSAIEIPAYDEDTLNMALTN